ncbi:hypothetical protein GJ629_10850 [Halapricum sp. CBA1109]|uniref:hypothetical protein n=1 Tax=Halapricum sp. CBA1109 TaxID=2668068 RepID=UPI0012F85C36|nr:hypothetical protein [Halapricum sp. CBA1109]MUV90334.1 hypothetical protein [Halapricum sp. CBA1109]
MEFPDPATTAQLTATATVAVVLTGTLLTGPLLGVVPLGDPPAESDIGDGTATVESASLSGSVTLSDGRFGTGVRYVRMPAATVDVASTTGRSRLVYRLVVPELDVEESVTKSLDSPGQYRLSMRDVAVSPDASNESFEGRVTVTVQSFAGEQTVYDRNVTVEEQR